MNIIVRPCGCQIMHAIRNLCGVIGTYVTFCHAPKAQARTALPPQTTALRTQPKPERAPGRGQFHKRRQESTLPLPAFQDIPLTTRVLRAVLTFLFARRLPKNPATKTFFV